MKCPTCNSTGEGGSVHYNTGFNSRTGMCSGYWVHNSECFTCGGSGDVPEEFLYWRATGSLIGKQRRMRGETMMDIACRLGISTSDVSAMEKGRKCPSILLDNFYIVN